MHDRTHNGVPFRILNIIDEYTRECLAVRVARQLTHKDVLEVLYELFCAIDPTAGKNWTDKPEEVITRDVCSESGLIPSNYCLYTITDFAIYDRSHNETCDIHKPVYVNNDETIQYCTGCLPSSSYKKIVYPVYQPELTVWLSQNKSSFKVPPAHNSECTAKFAEAGPKILSPSEDYEYFLEENSGQEILLLAASDSRVKTHYWYVNGKFYNKCKPGERVFLNPNEKELNITCLDDKGRNGRVSVNIKFY